MFSLNLISIVAASTHIFMFSAQSFCLTSMSMTFCDVDCKPVTMMSQKPEAEKFQFEQVYCRNSGGAKGFVLSEIGLYFPCSKASCPGTFGCERCCFDDDRDPKVLPTTSGNIVNMNNRAENNRDDETTEFSPLKDPIFIILGTILISLICIAVVVFTKLFLLIYKSNKEQNITKNEPKSSKNEPKTDKGEPKNIEKEPKASKNERKSSENSFDEENDIEEIKKTDQAKETTKIHVALFKANSSNTGGSIPKNKSKLNGRSCKVCPESTTSIHEGARKEQEEKKGKIVCTPYWVC